LNHEKLLSSGNRSRADIVCAANEQFALSPAVRTKRVSACVRDGREVRRGYSKSGEAT